RLLGPVTNAPVLPSARTVTPRQGPAAAPTQGMFGLSPSGVPWCIQPGSVLVIDRGNPTEETVEVTAVNPAGTTFTAIFRQTHAANASIILTSTGDRIPGKININTVYDQHEVVEGLADGRPAGQGSNAYTDGNPPPVPNNVYDSARTRQWNDHSHRRAPQSAHRRRLYLNRRQHRKCGMGPGHSDGTGRDRDECDAWSGPLLPQHALRRLGAVYPFLRAFRAA